MNMIPPQNIIKKIASVIFILLLINQNGIAQNVPIPSNHLVNGFIERHVTLGNLSQSDISVRPFTYTYVRSALEKLSAVDKELTKNDRQLIRRFSNEFAISDLSEKVNFPLSKSNIINIGKTALSNNLFDVPEPHFISYKDSNVFAWADLGEKVRLEVIDESVYRRFTDNVSIFGSISEKLSFFVDFTMNRFVGDSILVYQIEDYKNEDNPHFDFVNWTLWYQSNAAFNISTKYGNFQLGKVPVIWGFSPHNSPILSGATQTFPFMNYSFKNRFFGFHYLHGSLLPYKSTVIHELEDYPQKYLAGHRIEFFLSKNFTFSFNELVIYGNRPFEVEYLIPANFYWPAEHNLGDKDNLLMALDCSWRIRPGLMWYNTLFWDELAWEKLLSKWWGNKFVFQSGLHWTSQTNPYLIDLRVEGTISRPWTYTHEEFVNSYSSAEIGLGLPQGPNSQSLLIEVGLWPSHRWKIGVETLFVSKGIELGSSVLDNYNMRDRELDKNTPFLLGDIHDSIEFGVESNFALNSIIDIFGKINYNSYDSNLFGYLGMTIDW